MLLSIAAEHSIDLAASWMVGDTHADVQAGQAAGTRTILIATPGSDHKRSGAVVPYSAVLTLGAAVDIILASIPTG
jgi:D-glycero-D-manno-heptose 1,7-bisphosphate phosphatase